MKTATKTNSITTLFNQQNIRFYGTENMIVKVPKEELEIMTRGLEDLLNDGCKSLKGAHDLFSRSLKKAGDVAEVEIDFGEMAMKDMVALTVRADEIKKLTETSQGKDEKNPTGESREQVLVSTPIFGKSAKEKRFLQFCFCVDKVNYNMAVQVNRDGQVVRVLDCLIDYQSTDDYVDRSDKFYADVLKTVASPNGHLVHRCEAQDWLTEEILIRILRKIDPETINDLILSQ